ncbi:MAG: type II toxin-antitoxin system RelE/ParE family toxin [Spirochaetes bacterium]|nr:MAG: type II toxin-antitoxin system RelE/ParE family toxin [Spirochaetota bacterium]
MEVQLTDKAVKQLEKIAVDNKADAARIVEKTGGFAGNPRRKHDVKKLKGQFEELFRLRVGDYRVIFTIQEDIMIVVGIKRRQGAYND